VNPTIARLNIVKAERNAATLRIAEIDRILALGRAAYFSGTGSGQSMQERAQLTAERADLNHKRLGLNADIDALRMEAKDARAATLVRLLCAELEQRGMKDVIEDCRRRASETDPVVD